MLQHFTFPFKKLNYTLAAPKVVFNSLLILARSVVTRPGDPIISRADREIPRTLISLQSPWTGSGGRKADGERETESGQLSGPRSHISELRRSRLKVFSRVELPGGGSRVTLLVGLCSGTSSTRANILPRCVTSRNIMASQTVSSILRLSRITLIQLFQLGICGVDTRRDHRHERERERETTQPMQIPRHTPARAAILDRSTRITEETI